MASCRCGRAGWCEGCKLIKKQASMGVPLTHEEEVERATLERELAANETRHTQIVLRLAALERKRLGARYRFQNSHEAT